MIRAKRARVDGSETGWCNSQSTTSLPLYDDKGHAGAYRTTRCAAVKSSGLIGFASDTSSSAARKEIVWAVNRYVAQKQR